jgi:putative transposase
MSWKKAVNMNHGKLIQWSYIAPYPGIAGSRTTPVFLGRDKYLMVIQSWRSKWENLSVNFKYPTDIRRVIYTTNSIEAVHRQFRKLTKTKGVSPNEKSLLKLLYMSIQNASMKWTMPIHNWNFTLSQLSIYFEGRLDSALDILPDTEF